MTPPLATGKRSHLTGGAASGTERAGSEPIDASALSKALKEFEDSGNTRERTPGGSPSRKRQRIYGDRSVESSREGLEDLKKLLREPSILCLDDPIRIQG